MQQYRGNLLLLIEDSLSGWEFINMEDLFLLKYQYFSSYSIHKWHIVYLKSFWIILPIES